MNKNILTYEKSGVNIKGDVKFVRFTSSKAKKLNNIGASSSITKNPCNFKNLLLVAF